MYFDSHAHINDSKFSEDIDDVVKRARDAGVEYIIDVGYNKDTIKQSLIISKRYSNVFSVLGIHPQDAKDFPLSEIEWLKEQLCTDKCVGFGEIGLDYAKKYSDEKTQTNLLSAQLELAQEINKPLIFHSRDAEQEVLDMAVDKRIKSAVFHCYTGDYKTAMNIINNGYYLSFTGIVTFKNGMPGWINEIPLNRILIETDCPYLAPVPYRGKRNEPSYISNTCSVLAKEFKIKSSELAQITYDNAMNFFSIK